MTFDTLFNDLKSVYDYFITVFGRLIVYINSQPLLVLGVLVTVTLPAVYLIISFIISLSDSSDDITTEGFRMVKFFKSNKFKKKEKEMRVKFHELKNMFSKEYVSQKKMKKLEEKWDGVPLKIPEKYQSVPKSANPSSSSYQRSSANIDVEYDED